MKLDIKQDISAYQMKELLIVLAKKLNLEFKEKEIPNNIKEHFKDINKTLNK